MPLTADRSDPKSAATAATPANPGANPAANAGPDPQQRRRFNVWNPPVWSKQWGRQFARRLQDNARWMKQFLHGRK